MPFRKRNFVSLLLLGSALVIFTSGTLMYFLPHTQLTTLLHTLFGFAFVAAIGFHLLNNWPALRAYVAVPKATTRKKVVSKELLLVCTLLLVSIVGSAFHWQPFQWVYDWGQTFRVAQREETTSMKYEVRTLNVEAGGTPLTIDFRKGPFYKWPTYAFWVEDTVGNYIQTLYVTSKLATNNFYVKVVTENGVDRFIQEPESKEDRERPEALPVWAHQYGKKSERGNFVPAGDSKIADAYTGATPREHFVMHTKSDQPLPSRFVLKFEINHSFDWNDYYSTDRFPDDPVYSGNGKVGQPSVIYETHINLSDSVRYYFMKPVGHGHPSGADGEIRKTLKGITTALELVDRIIVEVPAK